MNNTNEVWISCEGFPGYHVSNHGNLIKDGKSATMTLNGGYYVATLYGTQYSVHRLVAGAFCMKPEGHNIVNHLDGVRTNNHADNLEWTTVRGNAIHAAQTGLLPSGEQHCRTELTEAVVREIDALLRDGVSNGEAAALTGVSKEIISKIKAGRTWTKVTGRTLAPIVRKNAVGKSKLTGEQVVQIRTQAAAGESARMLAATYGTSHTTIISLLRGDTWGE